MLIFLPNYKGEAVSRANAKRGDLMESEVRSDLAMESVGDISSLPAGVRWREEQIGGMVIGRLHIQSAEASETLGKPRGSYVTVLCGGLSALSAVEEHVLTRLLAGELRGMSGRLTGKRQGEVFGVLVIGLGNAELTADSIGPKTVAGLNVTRHLHADSVTESLFPSYDVRLSALAPGVTGQTGIEVRELLCGAVQTVHPDLIIAVDSLAARSCDRLAATVQISDTGIIPGSGVGNHRSAITLETVGVPVISVGVPTVILSSLLVRDALCEAGSGVPEESLERVLKNRRSFFVSPKDCDVVTARASRLLAGAINAAFVSVQENPDADA